MRRRQFIHMAAAYLLLPAAVKPCVAARSASKRHKNIFFDERFPRARLLAASWSDVDTLTAVQGDITPFWSDGLDRMCTESPVRLRGVTTDSFQFCLRILVGERADVDAQVTRLDQNLFVWTMSTLPKPNNGTTPWQSRSHRV